jgi:alpha-methylacyl-CoA racemase
LKELFLTKTRDEWCDILEGTDVCFGPVLNFAEAAAHPHNQARNTYLNIDGVMQPAPAPKLSKSETKVGVPPQLGADTDDLLRAAGLSEETIAELKEKGAV